MWTSSFFFFFVNKRRRTRMQDDERDITREKVREGFETSLENTRPDAEPIKCLLFGTRQAFGENLHWPVSRVQNLREVSCVLSLQTPCPSERLRHLPSQQAEECICFFSSVIMEQRGCHPNINICPPLHSSPASLMLEPLSQARRISPPTHWTSSHVCISYL